MIELESLRTETNKIFSLGGRRRRLIANCGIPFHYKDDYSDNGEQWKDIDLTVPLDGHITKAPYEVIIDALSRIVSIRDKKTNKVTELSLASIKDKVGSLKPIKTLRTDIVGNKVIWVGVTKDVDFAVEFLPAHINFTFEGKDKDNYIGELTISGDKLKILYRPTIKPDSTIGDFAATEIKVDKAEISSTVTVDVAASADDAFVQESVDSPDYANAVLLVQANVSGATWRYHSGARFQLNVPNAATITTCTFRAYVYGTGNDILLCHVYGHANDNSPNFITTANLFARTRTTANVAWSFTNVGVGNQTSPNINSVLQEVVNRAGWAANNYFMAILLADTGSQSENCYFHAKDQGSNPPQLYVDYTTGGGWANISKVNGVAAASIFKVNGIAVASISKINGVAV